MTGRNLTLITGASSGIGLHLAREFAHNGHDLALVAPDATELEMVAEDIRTRHGVQVDVWPADLEDPQAPAELHRTLTAHAREVDVLVNNAGQGQWGKFWEVPIERHLAVIRLNIEAAVRLTSLFLPTMVLRGQGRILNTASIAGFQPGPLLAVYHATKAFVLSWSEALAVETEGTGVTVTALCPGATDTDFFAKADMENTRAFQKGPLMAPQEVAAIGYMAVMRGDPVVVPGFTNRAMVFARRFMTEKRQARMNEFQYQEVPPEERRDRRGEKELAAEEREGSEDQDEEAPPEHPADWKEQFPPADGTPKGDEVPVKVRRSPKRQSAARRRPPAKRKGYQGSRRS